MKERCGERGQPSWPPKSSLKNVSLGGSELWNKESEEKKREEEGEHVWVHSCSWNTMEHFWGRGWGITLCPVRKKSRK